MLDVDWNETEGWSAPRISPRHNLQLDPACSVFHYAMEAFEGMKAFRDPSGKLRLFRPDMNMARLNRSSGRVGLPSFSEEDLLVCIKKLVEIDQDWCPTGHGFSLYIRPCIISTHPVVGVMMPGMAKLFVIMSPVGPYYPTGWKAVKLLCSEGYVRAFPGGTGQYKVGGNYALCMVPQHEAHVKGYSQVLWVFERKCTEVGTMNFFVLWKLPSGQRELVTCPLADMILPGVTRDSVLQLARKEFPDLIVSERDYTIDEVIQAIQEGRMLEAFGTGTAAVISPVCSVSFGGVEYQIPVDPSNPKAQIGPFASELYTRLAKIQYGEVDHPWTVTVP
jgi:branched-chain amino acid aminotransferase